MSRVLHVSAERHGAYLTLGEALAVAPAGAVLAVAPGVYRESLDLRGVTLTIAAADNSRQATAATGDAAPAREVVIAGNGSLDPVVRCRNGALTLRGISVRASDCAGVQIESARLTMEQCRISAEFGAALRLIDRSEFNVSGCTITASQQGVVIEDARGEVEFTTISDIVEDGVVVRLGADPTFRNCTIEGCGHRGVYVYESAKPTFIGCDISGTGDEGVAVAQYGVPILTRVFVHDTKGVGVSFANGTSGEVNSCRIEDTAQPALQIAPHAKVVVVERTSTAAGVGSAEGSNADAEKVETLLAELDSMVGLASVKAEVKAVIDEIQVNTWRRAAGLSVGGMSHHLIFAGAPGTGKTTVGRIYGQLLAALGVLPGGPLKEVSRRDLVGQWIGETAEKTARVFDEARGGVVFLDEAYALTRDASAEGHNFGREAVDMIVKLMEDRRNEIAVIAAGYTAEMRQFLDANPGLASRFVKTIEFENFSPEQLTLIITRIISASDYTLEPGADSLLLAHFETVERGANFGNGREARKLFELLRKVQSQRLSKLGRKPSFDELREMTVADVQVAVGVPAAPPSEAPAAAGPPLPVAELGRLSSDNAITTIAGADSTSSNGGIQPPVSSSIAGGTPPGGDTKVQAPANDVGADPHLPFFTRPQGDRFRQLAQLRFAAAGVKGVSKEDTFDLADGSRLGLYDVAATCAAAFVNERDWPELIDAHIKRLSRTAEPREPEVPGDFSFHDVLSHVFPVVMSIGDPATKLSDHHGYARPLAGDLVELLAVALPDGHAVLTAEQVQNMGHDMLRAQALRNLKARPQEQYHVADDDGIDLHVVMGSTLTASRLVIMENLLRETLGEGRCPDGVLVSVPTAQFLLFHPLDERAFRGLKTMVVSSVGAYDTNANRISPNVYWWQPGGRLIELTSSRTSDTRDIKYDLGEEFMTVLARLGAAQHGLG